MTQETGFFLNSTDRSLGVRLRGRPYKGAIYHPVDRNVIVADVEAKAGTYSGIFETGLWIHELKYLSFRLNRLHDSRDPLHNFRFDSYERMIRMEFVLDNPGGVFIKVRLTPVPWALLQEAVNLEYGFILEQPTLLELAKQVDQVLEEYPLVIADTPSN